MISFFSMLTKFCHSMSMRSSLFINNDIEKTNKSKKNRIFLYERLFFSFFKYVSFSRKPENVIGHCQ